MVYCGLYPVDRKRVWAIKRSTRKIKIKWCSFKLWARNFSCFRFWF
jgi:translation elongation factor EF-4